ncbi:MAG: glycosyltransferase [Lachnospiraceae bacterium]|nr:glycosyltransferase [Lachnospiraceae bacterium]
MQNEKRLPNALSGSAGRIYLCILGFFSVIYLVWRIGWTLPTYHRAIDIVFGVLLLLAELMGAFEMVIHYALEIKRKPCPETPSWTPGTQPDVDVLVPTRGEPVSVVEKTLRGCLSMEYPKGNVNIYLCDDAANEELHTLCEELGVRYLAREEHKDAKAGNLNYGLEHSSSPLVVVFDADMCPKPEFLLRTVPFFLGGREKGKSKQSARNLDEGVGFVQTPQDFRDADLFQRAFRAEEDLPNEQDFFYLELEPARNSCNAVIFGGSNTLLSRKALEDVGGFSTGTLTEDFATGIEIEKKGYRCIAIDTPLASGLSPDNLRSMIRQRSRWARGCIQAGDNAHLITSKGLGLMQRLSYLSAVTYWYAPIKRLVYLMAPLMFPVFGITVINCDFSNMLLFWLPMYLLASLGIRLFSGGLRSAKWSEIYEVCLCPFLLPGVIAETIGFSKVDFAVTDKSGKGGWRSWYPLPHLCLIALSVWGIVNTVQRLYWERTSIYLLLLFWLVFNLYELLYALVFVLSCRKLPPVREREKRLRRYHLRGAWRMSLLSIIIRIFRDTEKKEEKVA